jgi:hypothetical protein
MGFFRRPRYVADHRYVFRPGRESAGPVRAMEPLTASQRAVHERLEYRFWCGRCGGLIDDGPAFFCKGCRL